MILFREEAWEEGLVPVGRQRGDEVRAAQAGLEAAKGAEVNGLQSKALERRGHTAGAKRDVKCNRIYLEEY